MANQIPMAFADRIITVRLEDILPLRQLDFDPKEHRMYQRILASIRQIKLIEPLAARGFSPDEQQTRLGASAAHRMT